MYSTFLSLVVLSLRCTPVPCRLEQRSISTGTRSHLIWNKVTFNLELDGRLKSGVLDLIDELVSRYLLEIRR